ncbi:MAG: arginine repressor [Eubacterium sp.]|nr:arginine repressor [Eubacterium sp.]
MKATRHAMILELIQKYEIETQEELSDYLRKEGYQVTQATVSRDIRELKLTKVAQENGKQRYASLSEPTTDLNAKYVRVFKEGFRSADTAQNILVVKTVSGMAMAVAAALDNMQCDEIVGSIAGDDTIMCAVRTSADAQNLLVRLRKMASE